MSLYKRKDVWWIRFTAPDGQRVRRSAQTGDRLKAQEFHDRLKVELWKTCKLGERPKRHWKEAAVRWLKETAHKATHSEDLWHIQWLDPYFGNHTLDGINRAVIDGIVEARLGQGVSNATVNRLLALVRAILRKAEREWEWLHKAPYVPMLPEPKRRIRWLTNEQAQVLMVNLPPHLAAMARFTLATGLRKANVTGLRWSQIDLGRHIAWIHPDEAKARRAINVPLNADAIAVLLAQQGQHGEFVFNYRGHPVKQVNTKAWKHALAKSDITDFRWHDLRHTWASWHIQKGTPIAALQELGGWESSEMVRRYAHLGEAHLAKYAENVSQSPKVEKDFGTNLAHADFGVSVTVT